MFKSCVLVFRLTQFNCGGFAGQSEGITTLKTVCFGPRVALLKKSGEEDWKNRINRKQEVVKASSEQQAQSWDTHPADVDKVSSS